MGIEDLETLERIFSLSNALASVTRYMSAYRRRVFIDMFFRQWDDDKYVNLALMIYNNYCQALNIIEEDTLHVNDVLKSRNLTAEHLEQYHADEVAYFHTLGKEPEDDLHAIAYVELLQQLREIE
jgi:hypothetical protein